MKNMIYSMCCLGFITVIGGAVYEHASVVPQWAAAPPASLSMFQGEYGLKAENFWMFIHPINMVLFITALIVNWKTDRKRNLISVLTGYLVILIITAIYFVPELLAITNTTYATTADAGLIERGTRWEILNLVRLAALIGLSFYLLAGLTKPVHQLVYTKKQKSSKEETVLAG